MKKIRLLLLIVIFPYFAQSIYAQDKITAKEFYNHIFFLASDSLKGRKPGSAEDRIAAGYIAAELKNAGLKLLADNGLQKFNVITSIKLGDDNALIINKQNLELNSDFVPLVLSGSATLNSEVVFVGYGFDNDQGMNKWKDYADVNVGGKWVLILTDSPKLGHGKATQKGNTDYRSKVRLAMDKGAKGVMFVNSTSTENDGELPSLKSDRPTSSVKIPVVHISRQTADLLLAKSGHKIAKLIQDLNKTKKPNSFNTNQIADCKVSLQIIEKQTQNIVAILEGTDANLKNEYVVIGAHYDHLGMGGYGSGSRKPDTTAVHNGADDNASGVAAIMEIAEYFAANPKKMKRSLIVIAFAGEEMGLLGSKYFTENPLIDLKNIKLMLNFDMVGRLHKTEKRLMIGGVGTAKDLEKYIRDLGAKTNFDLVLSKGGVGPSDHASFYLSDVSVLFINTGAHDDYHTPNDDIQFINPEGGKEICDFMTEIIAPILSGNKDLEFVISDPQVKGGQRMKLKVTMGLIPDMSGKSSNGMRVDGVRQGAPAQKGGMLKGDIIVAIEGKEVTNIYDYMGRLKKLKKGQEVSVDVIRDGNKKTLKIQL